MNKKILSIFALIMAISILGVSCAKDNNTTAPTTTTPPIGETEANAVLNTGLGNNLQVVAKGSSAPTIVFDLSQVEVTASGANYTASVKSTTALTAAGSTLRIDDLVAAVEAKKGGMQTAGSITIDEIVGKKIDEKNATVTINYTAKNGKAAIVITFTLPDDASSNTIAYDENHYINLNAVKTAIKKIGNNGTVTVSGTTSGSVDFATPDLIAAGTITVDAKSSDASTALTGTEVEAAVKADLASLNLTGVSANGINITTENFDSGQTGTVTLKLTPDTGYKFETGGSDFATGAVDGSTGVLTITITVNSKLSGGGGKDWA